MKYIKPNTDEEATQLLFSGKGITRILAGGTDILVQMKSGVIQPDLIVDIKKIPGTTEIRKENGGYEIGAAVSGFDFNSDSELKSFAPGIAEAFALIGSTQIQGRCTMIGNLCNASPAADTIPALFASNCKAKIIGPGGARECPIEEIPVAPGRTSLKKGEFIKSIFIPPRPDFSSDAYLRFTPRSEMDIAVVSAAAFVTVDKNGICKDAKISLGAVAPTVINVRNAREILIGSKLDDTVLVKMAKECSISSNPIDDKRGTVEFRSHVAGVMAKRAAMIAYERAGEKI